ncbi:hypothetical protein ACIRSU_26510 [Streptomyces sp. NPDC101160]|uniref:hypothetical protein n=1 Tax=Streptomyces sp. NPDC101160 TaxID=3366118 RepID=UPI0038233712
MLAETICSAVSAAGLGIAAVMAFRKKYLAAARTAAYALLLLGLVMTGAVQWLADTAFSPVAWAGFGVLGGAWLLLLATRAVERRRAGRAVAAGGEGRGAVAPAAPAASAPSLGAGQRGATTKPRAGTGDEDFSDIEAILKKHGI